MLVFVCAAVNDYSNNNVGWHNHLQKLTIKLTKID